MRTEVNIPITLGTRKGYDVKLSSDFYVAVYEFFRDHQDVIDPDWVVTFSFLENGKPWKGESTRKHQALDAVTTAIFTHESVRLSVGRLIGTYWGRWLFYVKKASHRDMEEKLSETFADLGAPDTLKITYKYRPVPLSVWERL